MKINPNPITAQKDSLLQPWDDLLPDRESQNFDDPYARLSPEQLKNLRWLNRINWLLETGKEEPNGDSAQRANHIRQAFTQDGIDADWLLSQREVIRQQRIQQAYNPRADGQSVKLLGLVLPLSWTQDRQVSEFLLAPSLPNCSHMPPPRSHQVACIQAIEPIDIVAEERQQESTNLYLWVEGTLRFAVTNHNVYRVDGIMRIEAGYTIEPVAIAPAASQEIASLLGRPRRESEALLCPNLINLIE